MNRFKTSKYRNAFSRAFKKENWIHDLNVGSNLKSNTSGIKASCQYIAFVHNSSSTGSLAVVPLNSSGRNLYFPTVTGHSGLVTDFGFSPFNDCLLATGGEDGVIKLWDLPQDSSTFTVDSTVPSTLQLSPSQSGPIEGLVFNPVAGDLLASSVGGTVSLWDLSTQQERYVSRHATGGGNIQNFCWNNTGTLLATISKADKHKRILLIDPRSDSIVGEASAHSQTKDSDITWLGDSPYLVSTGYTSSGVAELILWDSTNMTTSMATYPLGRGAGIPLTFYDEDTLMLYVAVKGETSISFYELTDKSLSIGPNGYRGNEQLKGVALIPKRSVDVMSCEIDRLLVLTQSAIVPVSFHVQRKSYSDYHGDLFPDTYGPLPAMSVEEWFEGTSTAVRGKVSLDPSKRVTMTPAAATAKNDKKKTVQESTTTTTGPSSSSKSEVVSPQVEKQQTETEQIDSSSQATPPTSRAPPKVFNIVRSSKVRYIEGYLQHKSTYLEKIPALNNAIPGDSDGFTANRHRAAVALSGAGNRIAIFELNRPGRVDANEIYTVQNVTNVTDFTFDPFDPCRLVVACDDSSIKVWDIPVNGMQESLVQPTFTLAGHYEKPNIIQYHPLAQHILATAGYDGAIYIWNMETRDKVIELKTTPQPILAMGWSPDGISLATVGKDHMIRVYKPRESVAPVITGTGPAGSRGARLVWLDDTHFVISGFSKDSSRELSLYKLPSLSSPIGTLTFDRSPAIFKVHYDPDIKLIYLTGKGESIVQTVEFSPSEEPYLFTAAPYKAPSAHQDIKFLPKVLCDVKKVEVGQAVRLCPSVIEFLGFKIPRVKTEFFQDDIYCDTLVSWEPAAVPSEWLSGTNKSLKTVSLRPEGMKLLSEAPKASAKSSAKYSSSVLREKTDEEKKEDLILSMMTKMGDKEDEPLPQDEMDGVDSDEWDD